MAKIIIDQLTIKEARELHRELDKLFGGISNSNNNYIGNKSFSTNLPPETTGVRLTTTQETPNGIVWKLPEANRGQGSNHA